MATITYDGTKVTAKTLEDAKSSSLIAFHHVSGWNLSKIKEMAEAHEIYGLHIITWLSLWEAGEKVPWDEIIEAPLGWITPKEDETDRPIPREADASDPARPPVASAAAAAPEPEATTTR